MAKESTEAQTGATETEEIKKKILEAASRIYARKRLGDASVEEIATAAGVSPTVTYQFVSSESSIMQMIMEDILHQFKEQMAPRLKTIEDSKEKLAAAMDLYFEIVAREANKCLLVYQESKSMVKSARRRIMSLELGIVEIFKEILAEGMKQGVFRQGDPGSHFLRYHDAEPHLGFEGMALPQTHGHENVHRSTERVSASVHLCERRVIGGR